MVKQLPQKARLVIYKIHYQTFEKNSPSVRTPPLGSLEENFSENYSVQSYRFSEVPEICRSSCA